MRVALTGGSSGIGAAVAARLTRDGHEVTAFDITEPTENVARWIKTDLSDPTSISAALDAAEAPYDALINNAGLPPRDGLAALILKVNFLGFRAFHAGMVSKLTDGAAIVNTASRAGAAWRENMDEVKALMALTTHEQTETFITEREMDATRAYNLSKEAVITFTMAETEPLLARGIRINSVSPAAVSTGILDDFVTAFGPRVEKAMARAGRAGQPEEVASTIAFLISPDANWIRGQDIGIDGGLSAMATSDALGLAG